MIALKRVIRFLEGSRDFVNKLELNNDVDRHVVKLDGFRTVTGLDQRTRSRNQVAHSSLVARLSTRSAGDSQ